MQRYTFTLHRDEETVSDKTGIWFDDRQQALGYAHEVVRELSRGHEQHARSWRLEVDQDATRVAEILFAAVDPTLDHLHPELRMVVEEAARIRGSFREALSAARATMRETRALVARSRGKLYLASVGGEPTIRTGPPPPAGDRHGRG